jgi:hypothetical protein
MSSQQRLRSIGRAFSRKKSTKARQINLNGLSVSIESVGPITAYGQAEERSAGAGAAKEFS